MFVSCSGENNVCSRIYVSKNLATNKSVLWLFCTISYLPYILMLDWPRCTKLTKCTEGDKRTHWRSVELKLQSLHCFIQYIQRLKLIKLTDKQTFHRRKGVRWTKATNVWNIKSQVFLNIDKFVSVALMMEFIDTKVQQKMTFSTCGKWARFIIWL